MNPSSLLWYWQSNKNPWEGKEKPEWTPYEEAINLKIEEAYQKKENKINLGDYTIHFAPMIQMHNQDNFKQRKVRREGIKDNVRYFRYCDDLPNPKTINHPYGKSKDFLSFILDKIEEPIKSALQPLEALELKDDKLTFDPIITVVTDAIVLDVYNIPNVKPDIGRDASILADYIHNNSNTLENFYNSIIKIYTYECYFYSRLNQFLRNEDWTGLKTLLPYLYCFTLAFRFHNFRPDISNSIWTQAIGHKTLCLYRGAPLDKDVISFYDPKVNEYFSWSQVTSTSRRAEVAKGFFKKPEANKCNVFFEIRMFFPSNYDGVHVNKEIIDTQGRTFLPHENEYLLPPETVFHLISQEKKGDIYHIVLHVINNLYELEIQGYQLKSKVNPDPDTFHLFGLQGEKISEKIQGLEHNNVFKKIEISASRLSPTIVEELLLRTSTTEISELIFRNTFLSDQVFTVFRECLFLTKIQRLELYTTGMGLNREKLMLLKDLQYIHTLKLTGHAGQDPNNLDSETLSGLASLLPHTKLRFLWLLHFSMELEIYENILASLPETLSVLATAPSVIYGRSFFQSFFLKPEPKWKAEKVFFIIGGAPFFKADQIFDRIFKAAKFESLQLNFSYCERADVDDELTTLSKISVLNQPIGKLDFSFEKCQLSDQGLKHFSKFLSRLPLISELYLSFEKCPKITSAGIDYLKNSIKLMKSLKSIEMSFKSCKISTAITESLEAEFKDSFEIQITNDYNEFTDILIALQDFTEILKGKMPDENVYSAKQIYDPRE